MNSLAPRAVPRLATQMRRPPPSTLAPARVLCGPRGGGRLKLNVGDVDTPTLAIVGPPAAHPPMKHLSNYEVLQHFLALKKDNDVLLRATEAKKNRDIKGAYDQIPLVTRRGEIGGPEIPDVPPVSAAQRRREDDAARRGVSKDLVWVQDEVLKYLCADYNATARQTADGVRAVADGLQDYGLTKAELLQACNLAPINQVGMYLIMEEAEKRFQHYPGGYEQTVGTIISEVIEPSLLHEVPEELEPFVTSVQAKEIAQTILEDAAAYAEEEEMMYQEEEFVHEAEWGAGKEAAADDEEDNTMD